MDLECFPRLEKGSVVAGRLQEPSELESLLINHFSRLFIEESLAEQCDGFSFLVTLLPSFYA